MRPQCLWRTHLECQLCPDIRANARELFLRSQEQHQSQPSLVASVVLVVLTVLGISASCCPHEPAILLMRRFFLPDGWYRIQRSKENMRLNRGEVFISAWPRDGLHSTVYMTAYGASKLERQNYCKRNYRSSFYKRNNQFSLIFTP